MQNGPGRAYARAPADRAVELDPDAGGIVRLVERAALLGPARLRVRMVDARPPTGRTCTR